MTAYAIGLFTEIRPHTDIPAYMERIQATMDPYGGRFLVHNTKTHVVEGDWRGDVVVIEFPGLEEARAWYESDGYQEILPLRTDHVDGSALLVEGVGPGYDAAESARQFRARLTEQAGG